MGRGGHRTHKYTPKTDKHAQTCSTQFFTGVCVEDKQPDRLVTFLRSPSTSLSRHSSSLCPVNQIAISQYWSQGLVSHTPHIYGSISILQDGSPPRLPDSSTSPGEIKTVAAKSNPQRGGGGRYGTDQHVTGLLRLLEPGWGVGKWFNIVNTAQAAVLISTESNWRRWSWKMLKKSLAKI